MNDMSNNELMGLDDLGSLFEEEVHLDSVKPDARARDLSFFRNIPVNVTLEVASTELPLGDLMQVAEGSVIELDKQVGDPLDVRVNGRLLARGEVVVVNGKYGLRLVEIVDDQALQQLDD
ncbi:MAG: flagellar motor switch protein FliN [Aeromonadaceae bacterium]